MVLELLTNPDAFFERRADSPSFRGPVVVVVVAALVGIVGSVPVIQATVSALPAEAGPFVTAFQVIGAAFGIVVSFVVWALYAVSFHVIGSIAFDADGELRDVFALVGWGFVPSILANLVSAVASYLVFSGVQVPSDPQRLQRFLRELQHRPELLVAGLVGIAFLLWSAFLWTFAVKHTENLGLREAGLTVAGPVALALLLRLNNVFGVI